MSLVQVQYSSPFEFLVLYLKWIESTAHNRIVLGSIPSRNTYVPVAEMVDAVDLKSTILLKDVEVRVQQKTIQLKYVRIAQQVGASGC